MLTAQLNLHTRDLRVLDPMLTQMNPCAILCRERAILVNLEHVKCIVTTQYTIVLNVENRAVLSFLDELQKKLRQQVGSGGGFSRAVRPPCCLSLHLTLRYKRQKRTLSVLAPDHSWNVRLRAAPHSQTVFKKQ